MYYNTTNQTGTVLAEARKQAGSQEEQILAHFKRTPYILISPSVMQKYFPLWPITSIRRAITNLTRQGKLIKTTQKYYSVWNRPEYCWKYNIKEELF